MAETEPLGPMVRIRDLRVAHGLSIGQLVERIHEQGGQISEAGVSNIENGNKQASERLLVAWAKALGVSPLNVWHGPLRASVTPGSPQPRKVA